MRPNRFMANTDYGAFKNDAGPVTISATVPNNYTYSPSNPVLAESFIDIGQKNAFIRARGNTSKYSGWGIGTFIYSDQKYDIPSMPEVPIQTGMLLCSLTRISATRMKLELRAEAVTGAPDFRTREAQTITFRLSTFLSPFDS